MLAHTDAVVGETKWLGRDSILGTIFAEDLPAESAVMSSGENTELGLALIAQYTIFVTHPVRLTLSLSLSTMLINIE